MHVLDISCWQTFRRTGSSFPGWLDGILISFLADPRASSSTSHATPPRAYSTTLPGRPTKFWSRLNAVRTLCDCQFATAKHRQTPPCRAFFPKPCQASKTPTQSYLALSRTKRSVNGMFKSTCGVLSARRLRLLLGWCSTPVITFLQEGHRADSFRELHVNACH